MLRDADYHRSAQVFPGTRWDEFQRVNADQDTGCSEARAFLDRDDRSRGSPSDALTAAFSNNPYGQSQDPLAILRADEVAEGVDFGVPDVLNARLAFRHAGANHFCNCQERRATEDGQPDLAECLVPLAGQISARPQL